MTKPAFQPAPRPRPRTTAEDAGRLAEATGDLGFTRASTAQSEVHKGQEPKGALAPSAQDDVSLKIAVPKAVARQLRQAALDRGVTVRYLILEALATKGYAIDLASVPEDGRRNR